MKKQISTLYEIFHKANEQFFNNEIPTPTITIQTRGRARAYGWVSVEPIWNGKEKTRELNISAEFANRPFFDIVGTVLHEMAHLWNIKNGIKDCSRGNQYHNKKFKAAAEMAGLNVKKVAPFGWALTEVTEETKEVIRTWGIDENVFDKARVDFERLQTGKGNKDKEGDDETAKVRPPKTKKKGNSIKWVCPECGTIIRSTKEVNVVCGDCGVKFKKEE